MKLKYVFVDADEHSFQFIVPGVKIPALLQKIDSVTEVFVDSYKLVNCFDMGADDL
jgi:hypothetical protein